VGAEKHRVMHLQPLCFSVLSVVIPSLRHVHDLMRADVLEEVLPRAVFLE